VGRSHKENTPLARLGFGSPGLQCLGLEGFLRLDLGLGGKVSDLAGVHPSRLEELPHLGRSSLEPRQLRDPLSRFRNTGGWVLAKSLRNEDPVVG
jgi:hypothetical protein